MKMIACLTPPHLPSLAAETTPDTHRTPYATRWLVLFRGRPAQILKHLQINKFKVQLAVVMDLPLTVLNLWLLWMVDPALIKSALFLTSLIIAVFSAGKISTLIEYHLELRQRKRKLERLLLVSVEGWGDQLVLPVLSCISRLAQLVHNSVALTISPSLSRPCT